MKGNIVLVIFAISLVSLIITLNLFLQQNYRAEMAEQFNKQQLLLSSTVSNNIKSHTDHLVEETLTLSNLLSQRDLGSPELEHFVNDAFEEVSEEYGVSLRIYDSSGLLRYRQGREADREVDIGLMGLASATQRGGMVYKDTASISRTMSMATPIRREDKTRLGTVIVDIYLQAINKQFLAPIRSGQRGYAWMMSQEGTLLYHPTQPGMVGKNLFQTDPSCFKCHKSFEVEQSIISGDKAGSSSYIDPSGEDKLIAYSRTDVFDTEWIICVSVPYSEITASITKSMRLHSNLVIAIFVTALFGSVMMVLINTKRIRAEAKARHEEELERYAEELEAMVSRRTRELSEEKEKLNTIINAIGGGIMLIGNDGRVQWTNTKIVEMAGRDITSEICTEVCPGFGGTGTLQSTGYETAVAEDLFGNTGRVFQVTTAPVLSDEELLGYIMLVQDITEMRRVEEQLAHSEKFASIGRLTAGIAHEIGNPLTSVFSFLQILREQETEDFKKEALDTVLFHIRRIADIVRQLSGLSKTAAPQKKNIQINEVIENSIGIIQYDKRAKSVEFIREFSPDIPEISSDANQLSQVFVNLVLNAVDAMPDGGSLTISTLPSHSSIIIHFRDTGTGIERENITRLFDPFFTTKDKGTGLGLSVSYGIIKRLGGDMSVESDTEKGTTFTIVLPIEEAKDDEA